MISLKQNNFNGFVHGEWFSVPVEGTLIYTWGSDSYCQFSLSACCPLIGFGCTFISFILALSFTIVIFSYGHLSSHKLTGKFQISINISPPRCTCLAVLKPIMCLSSQSVKTWLLTVLRIRLSILELICVYLTKKIQLNSFYFLMNWTPLFVLSNLQFSML